MFLPLLRLTLLYQRTSLLPGCSKLNFTLLIIILYEESSLFYVTYHL
jgi:hypothetical protein